MPPSASAGVRHDSRAVEPGDLFVARRGANVDGARFVRDAVERGAVAVLADARRAVLASGARRADPRGRRPRRGARVRGRGGLRAPHVLARGRRDHRNERQDDDGAPRSRRGRRRARTPSCGVVGTVGHAFADWRAAAAHTTPEADELARVLAEMRRAARRTSRWRSRRIALALARVRAVRVPRRGVHEPHAGPPRLPRLDGGVRGRQGAPLHGARARGGRRQRRRSVRARCSPRGVNGPLVRVSASASAVTADAEIAPRAVRLDASGIERDGPHARRGGADRVAARRRAQPREPARSRSESRTPSGSTWPRAAAALSREAGAPGRLERCDGEGGRRHRARRLRAHARRARARARRRAGADARPYLVRLRLRRRSRREQARADGRGGRAPRRRGRSSRATTRAARTRATSPTRSCAGRRARQERCPSSSSIGAKRDRARRVAARRGDVVLIAGKGHEDYQIVGTTSAPVRRSRSRRAARSKTGASLAWPAPARRLRLKRVRDMATPIPANASSFDGMVRGCGDGRHGARGPRAGARRWYRRARDHDATAAPSRPGSAFVALRGERYDGHDYVGAAVESGARRSSSSSEVALAVKGLSRQTSSRSTTRSSPGPISPGPTFAPGGAGVRTRRVVAITGQRGQDDDEGALRGAPRGRSDRAMRRPAT